MLMRINVSRRQVAMNVYELSSAAGLPCEIDPALVVALSSQKSGKLETHLTCQHKPVF